MKRSGSSDRRCRCALSKPDWSRSVARTELKLALGVLGLLLIQMAVGEIQWRNALPWGLVLVHVALATAVWAGIVAIAARLLTRAGDERATSVTHTPAR